MKCQISLLCKRLSSFVCGSFLSDIRNNAFNNKVIGHNNLQATVKTHKPAGEVVCRPLHTSSGHVLNGLALGSIKYLVAF